MGGLAYLLVTSVRSGAKDYLAITPPRLYLVTTLPRLLAEILFYALIGQFLGGRELLLYVLVGNAVLSVATPALNFLTQGLAGMLGSGTLALVIATPTNPLWLIMTWGSGHLALGLINGLIGLYLLAPLFGLPLSPWALLAAPVLVLTTVAVYGLGLVLAAISLRTRGAFLVGNSVLLLFFVLVGVNLPIDALPPWLRPIGWSLPLSHGLLAIRALLSGTDLGAVPGWVATEAGVGTVYLLLGALLFQWQIAVGRRRGTLDLAP
jgi:ABC-2 type transport system permease protein